MIDLPGIKKLSEQEGPEASSRMRALHRFVLSEMEEEKYRHVSHAYVWNDSVLALGILGPDHNPSDVLRDVDRMKQRIDDVLGSPAESPSYAIAVQGMAFPDPYESSDNRRVSVLRTSSYAMGNCFLIEAEAKGRKLRYPWYLDDRLLPAVPDRSPLKEFDVVLMPRKRRCRVGCFDRHLWARGTGG